jgi:predicted ATPase/DNA-binding XRE family transcriptional regulator
VGTTFAELLRKHRRAAGLTQEELAERAGISPRGLRYLESGMRFPYRGTVSRLAAALELSGADLARFFQAARARRLSLSGAALPAIPAWNDEIVGRGKELRDLADMLGEPAVWLVTITGPAGVGKTRLAAEAAERLEAAFPDGVAWVPLAGIDDPGIVAQALMHALGGGETAGVPDAEVLAWRLSGRHVLLVLDNFEHVLPAATLLATIAAACPELKVIVTSRASLRLGGEREYELSPLPDDAAVQLFVRRARAVDHRFALTDGNRAAVAEICRRVDCLPLALELAAVRTRTLGPADMVAHLDHRLALLSSGAVDAPGRQRSLRDTLDWSYQLLPAREQLLLRRLAVFWGGADLAAIAEVCLPGEDVHSAVLDALDALRRKSLVQREEAGDGARYARYRLLETVREYALEALRADAQDEAGVGHRHAGHYAELSMRVGSQIEGPGQAEAIARLEVERDNIRTALRWFTREAEAAAGLRMAAAVWMFWYVRGYATEGRGHLAALLGLPMDRVPVETLAHALLAAGQLARAQGDHTAAHDLTERSLALYRSADDLPGLAQALLGSAFVARMEEDNVRARALLTEGLHLARGIGHLWMTAAMLHHLGMLSLEEGDRESARPLLEESLATYCRIGFPRFIGLLLLTIGKFELMEGNPERSRAVLVESLETLLASGERLAIHWALDELAHLAAVEGSPARAVTLAAAAAELREAIQAGNFPDDRRQRELWLAEARGQLGEKQFEALWSAGQAMSADEAVAYARAARSHA